ncbi:MAG: outer membrane protein assembly factor BamA [Gemmatimonadota bacterium]|nr:MAG: outer membrane protein assembly factor BamA [Gemmatimonadota bacterium]
MRWFAETRTRRFQTVLSLCALVLIGAAPAAAETVSGLRVLGNARAEEALIFQTFGVEVGDPYQVDVVRDGIRNLYRLGLFRDIRLEGERTDEGIDLLLIVEENPTLLRVRYDGADKLDQDDFDEVVELVAGQTVTPRSVEQARRDLLDLYHEKGFLLAEVTSDLKGDRRADLTFHIVEGKKAQVKTIRFVGNDHVAEDALIDVMKTKEDRWWRGGDFKSDVFEADRAAILSRLGQEGYVDARIVDVRKTFSADNERLTLEIEVEEGPHYQVGAIKIDHGGVIAENRLRGAISLQEGQSFDTVRFEESTTNLYTLLHEQGYIYSNVDVRRTPRDNVLDLEYVILEHEPARISRILITGNTRTKERVIRRELQAAPGDLFKRSRVIRSQREVFQLGFFNDIQMDSRSADRETGAIDLLLHVEERQTGTASLGAGVNSQAGLTGFLQLSQNNFMGKGQVIAVRAEFGDFREYDISFTEPWLFGTPTSAGVDAFDTRRRFNEFEEKRRGVNLRVGRPFPWLDYTRISTRYSLAEYRINARSGFSFLDGALVRTGDVPDAREDDIVDETVSTVSSVSNTLYRNSVDSPFFPTQGSSTRLFYEIGGGVLGGNEDYHLTTFSTKSHFRTGEDLVLSLSGQVGFLVGLKDRESVPFWKRFRLGGISQYGLRGYDDYDVVPNENASSTGGRSMLIMSSELRYRVVDAIQALTFFDVGNAWEGPSEMNVTDLRRGAGVGVRIDVPMVGQLGFDYGYGFDRTTREGGPGWEFHFQIGGQSF